MNILFAIKKKIYSAQEPMGIQYLSSTLQAKNHNVFLSDSSMSSITKIIQEKKIGIFAISCMNTDYKYYLELSQNVKKKFPRIPIIWGGPTPTYNPEIINEHGIDIICRGEGEIALLELLNRLDEKQKIDNIPNLWIKHKNKYLTKKYKIYKNEVGPLISNLDILPFPDRDLTRVFSQFKYSPVKFISVCRGCPFNCSFCFNHKFHQLYFGKGKLIRTRSVANVIEELKILKTKYNTKFFYFQDDVFPFEKQWLVKFAEEYSSKIKIPFTIVTSVVFIDDQSVKCLKKAGCVSIHIAIECGNEKIRADVLDKQITNSQIIKACNIIKKNGISICAYNMIGIPFSKFRDELETLDLNLKCRVDATYSFFCLPFPETKLGAIAKDAGLITNKTEFLSWFERIPIKLEEKEKIEKFALLFPLMVLFPRLRKLLPLLLIIPIPRNLLKFIKDIISGYMLKTKIIPVKTSTKEFFVTAYSFVYKRFTK